MEKKKLHKSAYGGVAGKDYVPFVTGGSNSGSNMVVILIGLFVAVLFAASTAYSGMKAGMTVAAGIPGAILGGAMVAALAKQKGILGKNLVQGMASGGESVASGMIFVLPAILIIGGDITFVEGFVAGVGGVLLGIGFASLVHNNLIVEEHGKLMYPEAMAISETLVATNEGGNALKFMGIGFAIGGFIHALSYNVFGVVNNTISFVGEKLDVAYKFRFETEVNPMLLGIGFIVGLETSMAMFAGAVLANFAVLPLIAYFAAMAPDTAVAWNNPDLLINTMTVGDIGSTYIKYIGAGMMLAGGIIAAIKLIPVITSSLKETLGAKPSGDAGNDSNGITKMLVVAGAIIGLIGAFFAAGNATMAIVAGILAIVFILMFAIVAGRLTGNIGTSNLPVSGMTIASLTVMTIVFVAFGWTDQASNESILLFGTFIVTGIAVAGGYMQSQKVTYIIGGSKKEMMSHFTIAAIAGVVVVTSVILLLSDVLVAEFGLAQANLMATLTQGIMQGNLPWVMIFAGVAMALVLFFLGLPIMTFAIGFYLPMATVSIVLIGSLVRWFVEKATSNDADREVRIENGISLSSGLVAGASIIGLLGIILQITGVITLPDLTGTWAGTNAAAFCLLVTLLVAVLIPIMTSKAKK